MTGPAFATSPAVSRNIWLLMAAGTAGSANLRAFDSALPQIAESLGVSLGQTGHFAAAYALAYGLSQLPFGFLGDRMNKLALVRGLAALSSVVMLLTCFAGSYPAMLALRLIAGAASSAVIPLTISYIGETVPFERRQMVLAWNMTALTTGIILGQAAGGGIADLISWHAIPAFIALLYLPAVIGLRGQPRTQADPQKRPPLRPDRAVLMILSRPFSRAVLIGAFLEGAFVFALSAFCGLSLSLRFDLPLGVIGLLLTIYAFGSMSNVFLVRFWPADLGMRGHFLLGGVASAGGAAVFALSPSLAPALVGLFLMGLGASMMHNNLQTYASQLLPQARATGFSLFATTFFLSQSAGALLFSTIVDAQGVAYVFLWPLPVIVGLALWFSSRMGRAARSAPHAAQ